MASNPHVLTMHNGFAGGIFTRFCFTWFAAAVARFAGICRAGGGTHDATIGEGIAGCTGWGIVMHIALNSGSEQPPRQAPQHPNKAQDAAGNNSREPKRASGLQKMRRGMSLSFQLASIVILVVALAECVLGAAVRQLVQQYILEKTDTQLSQQAQLVFDNYKQVVGSAPGQRNYSPTDYFLQIRDTDGDVLSTMRPMLRDGVISEPNLDSIDLSAVEYSQPFTVSATVTIPAGTQVASKDLKSANRDWRVEAFQIVETATRASGSSSSSSSSDQGTDSSGGTVVGVAYIGMSLRDMYETTDMVTQYFLIAGICTLVAAGVLAAMFVRNTLMPLKRMEKTAAKIAAGDLSERVPQLPSNTEVGSLALSLNKMLSQIERSFKEQEQTTEKMKQFVSDASHELRTPLATIHGYAELYKMQRRAESDDLDSALEHADDAIDHIETSSERMSSLVEDLLALARFDEGRGIDIHQTVQVDELIRESAEDIHALDPERSVRLGGVTVIRQAESTHDGAMNSHDAKADATGLSTDSEIGTTGDVDSKPAKAQDGDTGQHGGVSWNFTVNDDTLGSVAIKGDPMRMHQVLTNIIGNIHRYTPQDSPVEFGACIVRSAYARDLAQLPSTQDSLHDFMQSVGVNVDSTDGPAQAAAFRSRLNESKNPSQSADSQSRDNRKGRRTQGKEKEEGLQAREYAVVVVSDHGPGMRPDQRDRIFERFYTADPSRARLKGGTGLGMSIVQSVVHAHHGLICATQTPGGGLSYSIILPLNASGPGQIDGAPTA